MADIKKILKEGLANADKTVDTELAGIAKPAPKPAPAATPEAPTQAAPMEQTPAAVAPSAPAAGAPTEMQPMQTDYKSYLEYELVADLSDPQQKDSYQDAEGLPKLSMDYDAGSSGGIGHAQGQTGNNAQKVLDGTRTATTRPYEYQYKTGDLLAMTVGKKVVAVLRVKANYRLQGTTPDGKAVLSDATSGARVEKPISEMANAEGYDSGGYASKIYKVDLTQSAPSPDMPQGGAQTPPPGETPASVAPMPISGESMPGVPAPEKMTTASTPDLADPFAGMVDPFVTGELPPPEDLAPAGSVAEKTPGYEGRKVIAVIGTAGRDTYDGAKVDGSRIQPEDFAAMKAHVVSKITPEVVLVSGGAAWADHVAVQLFLEGKVSGLILHLPAEINPKTGMFYDAGYGSVGYTANRLHRAFAKKMDMSSDRATLEEISKAIEMGATVTYGDGEAPSSVGWGEESEFKKRNSKVAADTTAGVFAFTFDPKTGKSGMTEPGDGGTKDTWYKIKLPREFKKQINIRELRPDPMDGARVKEARARLELRRAQNAEAEARTLDDNSEKQLEVKNKTFNETVRDRTLTVSGAESVPGAMDTRSIYKESVAIRKAQAAQVRKYDDTAIGIQDKVASLAYHYLEQISGRAKPGSHLTEDGKIKSAGLTPEQMPHYLRVARVELLQDAFDPYYVKQGRHPAPGIIKSLLEALSESGFTDESLSDGNKPRFGVDGERTNAQRMSIALDSAISTLTRLNEEGKIGAVRHEKYAQAFAFALGMIRDGDMDLADGTLEKFYLRPKDGAAGVKKTRAPKYSADAMADINLFLGRIDSLREGASDKKLRMLDSIENALMSIRDGADPEMAGVIVGPDGRTFHIDQLVLGYANGNKSANRRYAIDSSGLVPAEWLSVDENGLDLPIFVNEDLGDNSSRAAIIMHVTTDASDQVSYDGGKRAHEVNKDGTMREEILLTKALKKHMSESGVLTMPATQDSDIQLDGHMVYTTDSNEVWSAAASMRRQALKTQVVVVVIPPNASGTLSTADGIFNLHEWASEPSIFVLAANDPAIPALREAARVASETSDYEFSGVSEPFVLGQKVKWPTREGGPNASFVIDVDPVVHQAVRHTTPLRNKYGREFEGAYVPDIIANATTFGVNDNGVDGPEFLDISGQSDLVDDSVHRVHLIGGEGIDAQTMIDGMRLDDPFREDPLKRTEYSMSEAQLSTSTAFAAMRENEKRVAQGLPPLPVSQADQELQGTIQETAVSNLSSTKDKVWMVDTGEVSDGTEGVPSMEKTREGKWTKDSNGDWVRVGDQFTETTSKIPGSPILRRATAEEIAAFQEKAKAAAKRGETYSDPRMISVTTTRAGSAKFNLKSYDSSEAYAVTPETSRRDVKKVTLVDPPETTRLVSPYVADSADLSPEDDKAVRRALSDIVFVLRHRAALLKKYNVKNAKYNNRDISAVTATQEKLARALVILDDADVSSASVRAALLREVYPIFGYDPEQAGEYIARFRNILVAESPSYVSTREGRRLPVLESDPTIKAAVSLFYDHAQRRLLAARMDTKGAPLSYERLYDAESGTVSTEGDDAEAAIVRDPTAEDKSAPITTEEAAAVMQQGPDPIVPQQAQRSPIQQSMPGSERVVAAAPGDPVAIAKTVIKNSKAILGAAESELKALVDSGNATPEKIYTVRERISMIKAAVQKAQLVIDTDSGKIKNAALEKIIAARGTSGSPDSPAITETITPTRRPVVEVTGGLVEDLSFLKGIPKNKLRLYILRAYDQYVRHLVADTDGDKFTARFRGALDNASFTQQINAVFDEIGSFNVPKELFLSTGGGVLSPGLPAVTPWGGERNNVKIRPEVLLADAKRDPEFNKLNLDRLTELVDFAKRNGLTFIYTRRGTGTDLGQSYTLAKLDDKYEGDPGFNFVTPDSSDPNAFKTDSFGTRAPRQNMTAAEARAMIESRGLSGVLRVVEGDTADYAGFKYTPFTVEINMPPDFADRVTLGSAGRDSSAPSSKRKQAILLAADVGIRAEYFREIDALLRQQGIDSPITKDDMDNTTFVVSEDGSYKVKRTILDQMGEVGGYVGPYTYEHATWTGSRIEQQNYTGLPDTIAGLAGRAGQTRYSALAEGEVPLSISAKDRMVAENIGMLLNQSDTGALGQPSRLTAKNIALGGAGAIGGGLIAGAIQNRLMYGEEGDRATASNLPISLGFEALGAIPKFGGPAAAALGLGISYATNQDMLRSAITMLGSIGGGALGAAAGAFGGGVGAFAGGLAGSTAGSVIADGLYSAVTGNSQQYQPMPANVATQPKVKEPTVVGNSLNSTYRG